MNDRFKFRGITEGWSGRYPKPTMVYGFYSYNSSFDAHQIFIPDSCSLIKVKPQTVGQCSGLKDKNGRLIYEGDILQTDNRKGKLLWRMVWEEAEFSFFPVGHNVSSVHANCEEDAVVIGNIHENSEMLEKKK